MVYYRKYRPQKISDLDSDAIRTTLQAIFRKKEKAVLKSDKGSSTIAHSVPHAFLFTGPKGLGKTSTARIIAKVVNCIGRTVNKQQLNTNKKSEFSDQKLAVETIEPCNECEQCTSITNGTNMDVLEIDAASNRGIDEIRDLKDKIRLAPLSSSKKVYIIDEVHMLTTEAFNALLKTLEEPPDHAMFILCTTEPHKVPGTIISRCFHNNFTVATDDEIVHSLQRIVASEKLQVDEEALHAIARMADGGFRDAAKILEEFSLLMQGEKITKQTFEKLYKTANIYLYVPSFLTALKAKDTKAGLEIIKTVVLQGVDIKFFISQLLTDLHTKLLKNVGVEKLADNTSADDIKFTISEIKSLVELLNKAYQDAKYAVLPQLPLELVVVEYCMTSPDRDSISNEDTSSQHVTVKIQTADTDNGKTTLTSLRRQVGTLTKIKAMYGDTKSPVDNTKKTAAIAAVELMKVPADGAITKEWQDALWQHIIAEMKQHNHTVAGVLRGCTIKNYDRKQLIIETAYEFHKERLDNMNTRSALLKVCKMLTGNEIEITVELKK